MRIFNDIKDALKISKKESKFDRVISISAREFEGSNQWNFDVRTCSLFEEAESWGDTKKIDFIVHCIHIENHYYKTNENYNEKRAAEAYKDKLLKKKLLIDGEGLDKILKAAFDREKNYEYALGYLPISNMLNQIKRQHKNKKPSEKMITVLERFKAGIDKVKVSYYAKAKIKIIDKINDIIYIGDEENRVVQPSLFAGEDEFTAYANPTIEALPEEQKQFWYQIIGKAKKISGGKPSQKYLNESKSIIKELGTERFKKMVNKWLFFLKNLKNSEQPVTHNYWAGGTRTYMTTIYLNPNNSDIMKGIVWMCAHFHDAETLQNITDLAERSYKKISGVGPAAGALGNACFYTLYKSKGLDGIGKLSTLKTKIKQKSAIKIIDKYLTQAAKDKGISLHEIQDLSIDDYGLNEGKRTYTFDDYTATISIIKPGKSTLTWLKPDGKTQKSIPAFVKTKHATKLKKMKNTKKQIDQTTSAQRNRIDRMFKADRTWNVEHFEKLFLKHGLMCTLAQKLIWTFTYNDESQSAFYLNGQWVNHKKHPVELHPKATITLWHPALCSLDEVQGWRNFLMENEIQQPLKQAFREIYLLTEAEINTRTYSNRMAAHIIKQHQYLSLVKARNWSASITGGWDSGDGTACLDIPEYELRAEFWAEGVRDDNHIFDYLSTDQIRFTDAATKEVIELVNIPPIVFSEVLRDVDLFVGVASVGNDPMWQDTGNRPGFRDYWHSYSFGDLSAIAKNRKEILENLVPRLKIKDVAEVTDKYVIVKGKLRTYKIHIGSSNIMMEPNDQYLCIVPDRSKKDLTGNLFIPFEGDKTLSVILSKAFLLANDDKITDSSITSQINRK